MSELAECFRLSVYVLESEPPPTRDRVITSDQLAAFLARALARAGRGDEYRQQCAWSENRAIPELAEGALRVEVLPPEWDDGVDWAMEHTTYRFSCASGEGSAEIKITKTYGPGTPY